MSSPDWNMVAEGERTNRFSIQKMGQKSDIVASSATAMQIDHSNTTSQALVKATLSHAPMLFGRGA
jgi:hypothetical protein